MNGKQGILALVLVIGCTAVRAQQPNQLQFKIDSTNRTLTVSAEERVTADPDLAIVHIGFQTPPSDSKSAYALGARSRTRLLRPSSKPEFQRLQSAARGKVWIASTQNRTSSAWCSPG